MARQVLILTASPRDDGRLQIPRELQGILDELTSRPESWNWHRRFRVTYRCARPDSLLSDIEAESFDIIHFAGHGTGRGLVLENELGNSHTVDNTAIKRIFKRVGRNVKCVLLNSCDSTALAESISEHVSYVIGMRGPISDVAAIAFSKGFYKALADGESIESAFERGSIDAHCVGQEDIAELFIGKTPKGIVERIVDIILEVRRLFRRFWFKFHTCAQTRFIRQFFYLFLLAAAAAGLVVCASFFILASPDPSKICSDPVTVPTKDYVENQSLKGSISSGEAVLFPSAKSVSIVQGTIEFERASQQENQDYTSAIGYFKKAVKEEKRNPEPNIYLNNAEARQRAIEEDRKLFTLAAVVPATDRYKGYRAKEILRGIADAQSCFNKQQQNCPPNPNGDLLEVKIVDDANDPSGTVRQVADDIVADKSIVGVIGHYSSRATQTALPIYQSARIGVISPTSTSSTLGQKGIFYRTVSSSPVYAKKIFDYIWNNGDLSHRWGYASKLFSAIRTKKRHHVVGFIDSSDDYSKNQWDQVSYLFENTSVTVETIQLNDKIGEDSLKKYSPEEDYAFILIPPSTLTQTFNSDEEATAVVQKVARQLSAKAREGSLFIGGSSFYSAETLIDSFDSTVYEGMVAIAPWFPGAPESAEYAKRSYGKWDGQVNWVTANSYDATQAFVSVLVSDGDSVVINSREDVAKRLTEVSLPSTQTSGRVLKFDENGESSRSPRLVKVVRAVDCYSNASGKGYVFELVPEP
jgi:ABC-type branched-subunit amino acid transport system substrate-binding protein